MECEEKPVLQILASCSKNTQKQRNIKNVPEMQPNFSKLVEFNVQIRNMQLKSDEKERL